MLVKISVPWATRASGRHSLGLKAPPAPPNRYLVSLRVGTELHVQLHGLFELLLPVHGLPDVGGQPSLEDLPGMLEQVSVLRVRLRSISSHQTAVIRGSSSTATTNFFMSSVERC
jgi:hypothetical protein